MTFATELFNARWHEERTWVDGPTLDLYLGVLFLPFLLFVLSLHDTLFFVSLFFAPSISLFLDPFVCSTAPRR